MIGSMSIHILPANPAGPFPRHRWDLYYGKKIIAYAQTRLGAERAKKEIAKILPAMPDPRIPVKPLTDEEREEADRVAHYEAINGVVTIDRRNQNRPGMNEKLICWRLNRTERIEAFRYGIVSRIVPGGV